MHTINNITKETWVLCHNGTDIFHVSKLEIGNKLETGQEFAEQFDTKEELEARINELNPQWLVNYKKQKELTALENK
jgi:hypothetical protein